MNNGEVIDAKAREMAASAIAGTESLRELLSERERNDERRSADRERNEERRWNETQSWSQDSFHRIENMIQTLQQSYRDGVESLSHKFQDELSTHISEDADQFERIADWKDKVLYSVIGFLAISVLSLIGAIYHMAPK